MKQVFLSGDGSISVHDVPLPGPLPNSLLVKNACSVISTGTEGAAVTSRSGILGVVEKATKSRKQVEQVWNLARSQGVANTLQMVRNKLDDHTMIGYCSAGQVVETHGETDFKAGDLVACMGAGFANHAEYVVVPNNLAARIPDNLGCEAAAFGSLACIAQQGLRVLSLPPGESVVVIGLGLIGALAVQLADAMGYKVFGVDISAERVDFIADKCGVPTFCIGQGNLGEKIRKATGGQGADAVVVCAATKSDDPINMAFELCRQKGRVAVVGDVGLGLDRAKMYRKELSLLMSTSYGPGRYDDQYELDGVDYPYGYVRWTERRNLEYFLDQLARERISLAPFISTRHSVEDAAEAYAATKTGGAGTFGVLLDYGPLPDAPQVPSADQYVLDNKAAGAIPGQSGRVGIGLIGCGGFAKAVHLPNLKALADRFAMTAVSTRSGGTAAIAAKRHKIPLSTSDHKTLLDDAATDAILISTRHASHGALVAEALHAGKHVFVEKPMCLDVAEGQEIEELAGASRRIVRVGFNRRFAPLIGRMRQAVGLDGERLFSCRVNVGSLAPDHWSNKPEEGGRFLGEGVHFLDLCNWFIGLAPEAVSATYAGEPSATNPNLVVSIKYPDGSLGQIVYTTRGNTAMGKEYYEAFGNGVSAQCDDFQSLLINGAKKSVSRAERGNKGQRGELEEFAAAIAGDDFEVEGAGARSGWIATWMALAALQSAREGRMVAMPRPSEAS